MKRRCRDYEIWESRYRAVYEKFIKNPPDNPVKIAILDTGVDETHPDIDACGEQIKGRHNWTDGPPDKRVNDNTGHGTFVAALLLKYAPDAEVYIAKVCDTRQCSPRTIAKVGSYKVRMCKPPGADLILV